MWYDMPGVMKMIQATLSINKGQGDTRHDNRTRKEKHPSWNPDLSGNNVVLADETADRSIRQIYDGIFGEAFDAYQDKIRKTHPERLEKSYYDKIRKSGQEKPLYSLIYQIGSADTIRKGSQEEDQAVRALADMADTFSQANPAFHVVQAIIHRDEEGIAHLHMKFIPVASGGSRGMAVKNSLGGALKEMGYGRRGFSEWRESEQSRCQAIMRKYGFEYVQGQGYAVPLPISKIRELRQAEKDLPEGRPETAGLLRKPTGNTVYTPAENAMLQENARLGLQYKAQAGQIREMRTYRREMLKTAQEALKRAQEAQEEADARLARINPDENARLKDENRFLRQALDDIVQTVVQTLEGIKNSWHLPEMLSDALTGLQDHLDPDGMWHEVKQDQGEGIYRV